MEDKKIKPSQDQNDLLFYKSMEEANKALMKLNVDADLETRKELAEAIDRMGEYYKHLTENVIGGND